jgi:sulfatase maturation enzyme AslB (radical SAM superfamily)
LPKRIKVEYVKRDYDLNKGISLPQNITPHFIDGKHLFIAPDKASWISTNEIGKIILECFRNEHNIKMVIDELRSKNLDSEVITTELRDFLVKVEKKGFLEDAVIREEESEISLQLYLTNACNLKCSHCYLDAGKAIENELSPEEFGTIIDEFASLHRTKVVFTGGKPLLYSDKFFKLANRAKKNNLNVQLFTNGTLVNQGIIEKLNECVDEIQFSLDGATAEVNDEIRGKGVFNKVLENLRLLMNTKIKLKLSMVIMPRNVEDLKKYRNPCSIT